VEVGGEVISLFAPYKAFGLSLISHGPHLFTIMVLLFSLLTGLWRLHDGRLHHISTRSMFSTHLAPTLDDDIRNRHGLIQFRELERLVESFLCWA